MWWWQKSKVQRKNSKQKQSKNGPLIKLEVESGAMKEWASSADRSHHPCPFVDLENDYDIVLQVYILMQVYISLQVYILIQTPCDYDPLKHVQQFTLSNALSYLGWFIENESRFLINFTITCLDKI